MPSLREYLPGVPTQYWRRYYEVIKPTGSLIIEPGTVDYGILPTAIQNVTGLFSYVSLTSSSADLVLTVTIDDNTFQGSISSISDGGYVGYYNPNTPWLSVNGTGTPAIYVVNYGSPELKPFYRNITVQVSNPTTSIITISEMSAEAYVLSKGFYRELAKVIAGQE